MEKEILSKQDAVKEAKRCLGCKEPTCIHGCPLGNHIPQFLAQVKEEQFEDAYRTLLQTTILSEVCGRICPQYKQCSGSCILGLKDDRPIAIGQIERFVADEMHKDDFYLEYMDRMREIIKEEYKEKNKKKKIAVIGSGPSGIACAYYLIRKGFSVTIFEREKILGGVLTYGIPEYRLPNDVVQKVMYKLMKLGVEMKFGVVFGEDIFAETLVKEGYDAIFLGIGLGQSKELEIDGKNLKNVYLANEFLYAVNREDGRFFDVNPRFVNEKNVVVIGGGYVGLDCARTAKRLGAKSVKVVYRRTEEELLVSKKDRVLAEQEGVEFEYLTLPIKFLGHHKVEKMECVKMQMGEQDETGRRKPMILIGSNYEMETDYVIVCVGSKPEENSIDDIKDLVVDDDYTVKVNEYGQTSVPYIFAGGDICTAQSKTVAVAAHSGTIAAVGIENYLNGNKKK